MFWIAQKLLYTTRTRSGPAPASRRRATAGKWPPEAPVGPVRVVGYAESRGAFPTASGCSGPLLVLIPVAYSRWGHVIAASWCPPGSARRPVIEARAPLGHLDHRPARRLSASCVAPACLVDTPVSWRRPQPSLRSTCRVSARLGHCVGGQGQPDPKALSWQVRTRRSCLRYHLGGPQPAGRFACAMA